MFLRMCLQSSNLSYSVMDMCFHPPAFVHREEGRGGWFGCQVAGADGPSEE